jgi:acyl carrier protein phosphodiesterase
MNFLSHYYFDQHSQPNRVLGVVLPDLAKTHDRKWNLHPHKHTGRWKEEPALQLIADGWQRHVQVDELFHESGYFREKTELIKTEMQRISFGDQRVRPYILAHIGLEIILDTLLIRHRRVDVNHFYRSLAQVPDKDITGFLSKNNIPHPESFIPFYERFNTVQYLFSYKDNESVVYALNRINHRMLQTWFPEAEIQALNECFALVIENIEKDYLYIFDLIAEQLN